MQANQTSTDKKIINQFEYQKFVKFTEKNNGKLVFGVALADKKTGLIYLDSELFLSDPLQAHTYAKMLFYPPKNFVDENNGYYDVDESDNYYYYTKDADGKYTNYNRITKEEYETMAYYGLDMFSPVSKPALMSNIDEKCYLVHDMGGPSNCKICYSILCEDGSRKKIEPNIVDLFVQEHGGVI